MNRLAGDAINICYSRGEHSDD